MSLIDFLEKPVEIVMVGHYGAPKHDGVVNSFVPAMSKRVMRDRNVLRELRKYEKKGLTVNHGISEGNTHYVLINRVGLNEDDFDIKVREEERKHFPIELVLSDWSGVVSDDRHPVYKANMQILEKFGKPTMSFEEWLPKTTLTPIEFCRNNGITSQDISNEDLWRLYKNLYSEQVKSGNEPFAYSDVRGVLDTLVNELEKPFAVLSSHPQENIIREAKEYHVNDYIDFIMGNSKNKANSILQVCDEQDIRPENILYLGDTIFDVQAAKEAGARSVALSTGYHVADRLAKEKPEFQLTKFSDIIYVVAGSYKEKDPKKLEVLMQI